MTSRTDRRLALLISRCCLALLTVPAGGCRPTPSISFRVSVPEPAASRIGITIAIENVTDAHQLTLRGFAAREVMRIDSLTATGGDGAPLRIRTDDATVNTGGLNIDYPRYTIEGPLPAAILVRYTVSPGRRQGDAHMGYTGVRFGDQNPYFVFAVGRQLFLLPEPAEAATSIRVQFDLPDGWGAITPWRERDHLLSPGIGGRFAAEDLISAAIGMGRFREVSFTAGRTWYRLFFVEGTPQDEIRRASLSMGRAARFLEHALAKQIGPTYVVLALPESPGGDEIAGEAWAGGQGGTLMPATDQRLQRFAEGLADARLRFAPYRVRVKQPEDFWLVDAASKWYSWRAVAAAGLISRDDIERVMALEYVSARQGDPAARNLERLYSTSADTQRGREQVAPFVLAYLDREIRRATRGRSDLDQVIGRAFVMREIPSLWSVLPGGADRWRTFRERYVRGKAPIPVNTEFPLAQVTPKPDPPGGTGVHEVTVAYTGDMYGYLETCGCKQNQAGGVARRATVLDRLRQKGPLLLVDAGNSFVSPTKRDALSFLSLKEQRLFLETSALAGYDAAAIGPTELAWGIGHFRLMTGGLSIPYVCANVRESTRRVAPAAVLRRLDGLTVAILGVIEPPRGPEAPSHFENRTVSLEFEDPVEVARREVPRLKRLANLVFVLGRLSPYVIRRIAAACPELDAIVSSEDRAPVPITPGRNGPLATEDEPGFIGRTLVLYSNLDQYGVSAAILGLDPKDRIVSARIVEYWLTAGVPDQRQVRGLLNDFYDRVGHMPEAQASVMPPFAGDAARQTGRYAGATACAGCHEPEFRQWKSTPHASAYKTLLDAHRHYQPACVSCHVVGYGATNGYRVGDPEDPLGNVQCEVCHGPGAEHAKRPGAVSLPREVPEAVCLQCHTPDHSDHFVYAEKLVRVRHVRVPDRLVERHVSADTQSVR